MTARSQERDGSWGKIANRTTKQTTASKSAYSKNWHIYQLIKFLSGPLEHIIPEAARVRAINLAQTHSDVFWMTYQTMLAVLMKPQRQLSKALRTPQ